LFETNIKVHKAFSNKRAQVGPGVQPPPNPVNIYPRHFLIPGILFPSLPSSYLPTQFLMGSTIHSLFVYSSKRFKGLLLPETFAQLRKSPVTELQKLILRYLLISNDSGQTVRYSLTRVYRFLATFLWHKIIVNPRL